MPKPGGDHPEDSTKGRKATDRAAKATATHDPQEKPTSEIKRKTKPKRLTKGAPAKRGIGAMQNTYAEVKPRNIDLMSVPGLSDHARKALNEVFEAMSTWRVQTAKSSEKNSEQLIEKMAAAARALGWPDEIVEAARGQMQSITKLQIQMMDHIMDAWEDQIKAPNPMTNASSAMLSKLQSFPGFNTGASRPGSDTPQSAATNPFQFWMQFAEQLQKASAESLALWAGGGRPSTRR
jgi:hypothetical protein